jgi:hypothetical protein
MKFGHKFSEIIEATHPSVSDQVRSAIFVRGSSFGRYPAPCQARRPPSLPMQPPPLWWMSRSSAWRLDDAADRVWLSLWRACDRGWAAEEGRTLSVFYSSFPPASV